MYTYSPDSLACLYHALSYPGTCQFHLLGNKCTSTPHKTEPNFHKNTRSKMIKNWGRTWPVLKNPLQNSNPRDGRLRCQGNQFPGLSVDHLELGLEHVELTLELPVAVRVNVGAVDVVVHGDHDFAGFHAEVAQIAQLPQQDRTFVAQVLLMNRKLTELEIWWN